jgi:hypothetical protein
MRKTMSSSIDTLRRGPPWARVVGGRAEAHPGQVAEGGPA